MSDDTQVNLAQHAIAIMRAAKLSTVVTQSVCDGPVIHSIGDPASASADDWAYYKARDSLWLANGHCMLPGT